MQASIDVTAHIIQIALTPIFLLVGIAGLLNVFSTRHSYVTQHVDQVLTAILDRETVDVPSVHAQLENLRRRSRLLDIAVVLGVLAGCSTCLAAATLFVSELAEGRGKYALFVIFGAALGFTVTALAVFSAEMLMSGKGLRGKILWAETATANAASRKR